MLATFAYYTGIASTSWLGVGLAKESQGVRERKA